MPPNGETWRDWLPEGTGEPALYTREEIAEKASGIDPITGDDIRYWEYQGVLPRSIRRHYAGATRAVYPEWYAGLAGEVRRLQRRGLTLEEIKPKVRQAFRWMMTHGFTETVPTPEPSATLSNELERLARALGEQRGSPPRHIVVDITLENGSGETYAFRITNDDGQ